MAKVDEQRFCFTIDAKSPESFPLVRLGAYLVDLGTMLGEKDLVSFVAVEAGSTRIVHRVAGEAVARVDATLTALAEGRADPARQRAYAALDQRLKEDGSSARYTRIGDDDAVVLAFPGVRRAEPVVYGPIEQRTVIDGTLIALGGRDATVPVRILDDGMVRNCTATRAIAKSLAPFLFGEELRLNGIGKWTRHETDGWKLENLRIESFEPLGTKTLVEEVGELRAIEAVWDGDDLSGG